MSLFPGSSYGDPGEGSAVFRSVRSEAELTFTQKLPASCRTLSPTSEQVFHLFAIDSIQCSSLLTHLVLKFSILFSVYIFLESNRVHTGWGL